MVARKLRVGVLFGGRSGEHEVSLLSAASILTALDRDKYEIVPIGITREGKWFLPEDAWAALKEGLEAQKGVHVALLGQPAELNLLEIHAAGDSSQVLSGELRDRLDVVFPVLHGPYGEDGTIQGLLELAGIPYVGAGVLGSAVGMDKGLMKTLFRAVGLPVADFLVFLRREVEQDAPAVVAAAESRFAYPMFVKPANLGSSVGVVKAHNREELYRGLQEAIAYDRRILVEQGIENAREIELSVLGNDDPRVSVPGEIIPANEFYDYEAKYLEDSGLIIPAELSPEIVEKLQAYAIQAFKAIDCAGMARVDFLVRREDNAIFVNEINTIPGFTQISMYPKLWEASGLSYPELLDRLIELALERHQERQRSKTTYK